MPLGADLHLTQLSLVHSVTISDRRSHYRSLVNIMTVHQPFPAIRMQKARSSAWRPIGAGAGFALGDVCVGAGRVLR